MHGLPLSLPFYAFFSTTQLDAHVAPGPLAPQDNPAFFFVPFCIAMAATCLVVLLNKRLRRTASEASLLPSVALVAAGASSMFATAALGMPTGWAVLFGGCATGHLCALMLVAWSAVLARLDAEIAVKALGTALVTAFVLGCAVPLLALESVSIFLPSLALILSSIAVDRLRRTAHADRNRTEDAETPSGMSPAPIAPVLAQLQPLLLASLLGNLIVGFTWGNALNGSLDHIEGVQRWASVPSQCAGAVLGTCLLLDPAKRASRQRPLALAVVGLWLVSWLVTVVVPSAAPLSSDIPTGLAGGMVGVALWTAVCTGHDCDPERTTCACCLAGLSLALPLLAGILLAPLIGAQASMLFTPVCCVAFLVACQVRLHPMAAAADCDGANERKGAVEQARTDALDALREQYGLSQREAEVLGYLVHGHSSNYISEQMGLSVYTVKTHVKHIYAKMDVHSKDEFLAFAARHGL